MGKVCEELLPCHQYSLNFDYEIIFINTVITSADLMLCTYHTTHTNTHTRTHINTYTHTEKKWGKVGKNWSTEEPDSSERFEKVRKVGIGFRDCEEGLTVFQILGKRHNRLC